MRTSIPRSAPIDRSFAASVRSSPVTISVPQCVNIARGPLLHAPAELRLDPSVADQRFAALAEKEREIVAPSPINLMFFSASARAWIKTKSGE